MSSFSLVADSLTGLIYHRPSGENSKFAFAQPNYREVFESTLEVALSSGDVPKLKSTQDI